jgi:hypothetical protein
MSEATREAAASDPGVYERADADLDGFWLEQTRAFRGRPRRQGRLSLRPRAGGGGRPGDLPKTRSGKIMRRLLKDVAEGHELGDTTTLRDPAVVEDLRRQTDAVLRPG